MTILYALTRDTIATLCIPDETHNCLLNIHKNINRQLKEMLL